MPQELNYSGKTLLWHGYKMRRALYSLAARTWSKVDFFSLKVCESLNNLLHTAGILQRFEKVFLILSVDTENDLYTYKTNTAGWEVGIPYILDIFSENGVNGRACWLMEFNVKDGLRGRASVANYKELIQEIRRTRYEFGLHPIVHAYTNGRWDGQRPCIDSAFVFDVIHQGTVELMLVCGEQPVGCRTSNFHFALGLAQALENEGYLIDSSSRITFWHPLVAPNAWLAGRGDYRMEKTSRPRTDVLEVPTTDYITAARGGFFSLEFKPCWKKSCSPSIIFLSAFFHNWNAVREDGRVNPKFRDAFENFWASLEENNVKVVSFSDAYQEYKNFVRCGS